MKSDNEKLKEVVRNYEVNKKILEEIKESYRIEEEVNKQIDANEKRAMELLKNPTKANLITVKNYIKDLCATFKIPFKDELNLEKIQ